MKQQAIPSALIYGCLIFLLTGAAFLALWEPVRHAVPETDHGWMLPALSHYLGGRGPVDLFLFILSQFPTYGGHPLLKTSCWLIGDFLELPFRYFLFTGLLIHGLNSALLAWLCRLLGLSWRIAVASGVIFGTIFVHFHSYLWFPVSEHSYALLTILTVLALFFLTERRAREGKPFLALYAFAALAAAVGSLQRPCLLVIPLMASAVWFVPGLTIAQRRDVHLRWMPVWVLLLVYPLITTAYLGDDAVISAVSKWPLPPGLKAAGLILSGVGVLFLMGWFLRFRRFALRAVPATALAAWALLALWDSRQALLPYNALVPWMTVLGSFLDPFHSALRMDPTDSYYYVPAQVSVFHLVLTLFLAGTFILGFARKKRALLLLGVWYGMVLAYLLLHSHVASGMPFRTQSRYFLYLTPIFSIVFSSAAVYGLTVWCRRMSRRRASRDLLLAGLLLALCVPNLLAIRVALFRGLLANTYLVYDDLRVARLIREDLAAGGTEAMSPADLFIQNAVPTLFSKIPWNPPLDYGRIGHENLRMLLGEAFQDRRMRSARINADPLPGDSEARLFRIRGDEILDGQGRSIEPFRRMLTEAIARLNDGDQASALDLLKKAALERPFFLNYVLSRNLRLADLTWITGGEDFLDYFEVIRGRHGRWGTGPTAKIERTSELIRAELSSYLLCLFLLSYLEQEAGRLEMSRFWLSQLGFIEREPEALAAWLGRIPEIRSWDPLRSFLEKIRDPSFFREPLVRKKEDYGLGRFLVRLIFHWDIRSTWDNRFGVVP